MPLVPYSLAIVKREIDKLKTVIGQRKPRVLTLSTPDLIAHQAQLETIFGKEVIERCKIREDSVATINWHKAHSICKQVYDTRSLFESLGCEYYSTDMVEGRGGEVNWDLNLPWCDRPDILKQFNNDTFDLVFDCISNQVFNFYGAMCNAWGAVKLGGVIIHVIPVQMVNQGFFGVSPAAYFDYYRCNFGEIEQFDHIVGVYAEKSRVQLDHIKRERLVPDDTMNVVVVRKQRDHYTVAPYMTKFLQHPKCQL